MNYPRELLEAVAEAERNHADNISDAVDEAFRVVSGLPCYEDVTQTLLRDAVRQLVYEARHSATIRIKKDAGCYGGPAVVNSGASVAVNRVQESVYRMRIAGHVLGDLLGADLADVADAEKARADGHMLNYYFVSALRPKVRADQRVREALSEQVLQRMLRAAERRAGAA